MAATSRKVSSKMVIAFKAGINKKGEDVIKEQKFPKLKTTATDDSVLEIGKLLGGILADPMVGLSREDECAIS